MSLHVSASIKGRLCLCMCLYTLKAECISAFVDVYQLQSWYLHILPSSQGWECMRMRWTKGVAYMCVSKVESTTLSVGAYRGLGMYLRVLACIGSSACVCTDWMLCIHLQVSLHIKSFACPCIFWPVSWVRRACMFICWRVQTTRRVSKCVCMHGKLFLLNDLQYHTSSGRLGAYLHMLLGEKALHTILSFTKVRTSATEEWINVSLSLFIPDLSYFIITKKINLLFHAPWKVFEPEILTNSRRTLKHTLCFKVPRLSTTSAKPTCQAHAQQLKKA